MTDICKKYHKVEESSCLITGEYCLAEGNCIHDLENREGYQIILEEGFGKACILHGKIPKISQLEEEVK